MLDHLNKICGQVTSTRDFCTYKKKTHQIQHKKFAVGVCVRVPNGETKTNYDNVSK